MTAQRKRLPNRRHAINDTLVFGEQRIHATAGVDPETGAVCEVFLTCNKEGSLLNHTLGDAATVISVALQHGVSIEALRVSLGALSARSLQGHELDALPADARVPASPIGVALDFLAQVEAEISEASQSTLARGGV